MPFSVALTMAGGHKVSAKQSMYASFFSTSFSLNEMNFGVVMKQALVKQGK